VKIQTLKAVGPGLALAGLALVGISTGVAAAETPKRGGTLTYVIPADAPPSFDGRRETTFATAHSVAPFYSVLVRVNPENPSSTTDFVCDLCTEMPTPTDGGKTYTFKIRDGVKWHDGAPLTAADVAASWQMIVQPLDTQAHEIVTPWWYRIIAHRSYVKGWKISPSHYLNQDLAMVWLDQ
jgi:peptide/nickel transport system substrate-binding protein